MVEESKLIDKCPMRGVIDIVGKKWALLIVAVLGNSSSMRYTDLMKELRGVSPKTLADTLKELQGAEIVRRESFNEIPPRVEYSLTQNGAKLREAIIPLIKWAVERSSNKDCIICLSAIQTKRHDIL